MFVREKFFKIAINGMTARDNLYRFLVFFVLLIIIIFVDFVWGNKLYGQEVMPLNQVKPGMKCYGLTAFEGNKLERFDCEILNVRELLAERRKIIEIRISGGPDNGQLLQDTRIMEGMSGSPIYSTDGFLIGSIESTEAYLTKAYGNLRPAENTLGLESEVVMGKNQWLSDLPEAKINENNKNLIKPGEAAATCLVWNDEGGIVCAFMTVVADRLVDKVPTVYLAGHEIDRFNTGPMGAPLFSADVLASVPFLTISSRLFATRGKPIGSIVFNNTFGLVGKIGIGSKYFSVIITVVDAEGQRVQSDHYYFSYSKVLTPLFQFLINSYTEQISDTVDVDLSYDVYIGNSGVLNAESKMWDAIPTLPEPGTINEKDPLTFLDEIRMLVDWENLNPNINTVDLKLRVREKYKTLRLTRITSESIADSQREFLITIFFKDEDENEVKYSAKYKLDEKYEGKKLNLSSGNVLADYILKKKMNHQVTLPLLDKIKKRNLLYLYYIKDDSLDDGGTSTASQKQGWETGNKNVVELIQIIGIVEPPKDHIFLGKKDFIVKQASPETKVTKPKRFRFF